MILHHRVQVKNSLGLHARPAVKIAQLLKPFDAAVLFTCNSKTVNAKQVMELLLLEATKHTAIDIQLEGHDAKRALIQLIAAFECGFEEGC